MIPLVKLPMVPLGNPEQSQYWRVSEGVATVGEYATIPDIPDIPMSTSNHDSTEKCLY